MMQLRFSGDNMARLSDSILALLVEGTASREAHPLAMAMQTAALDEQFRRLKAMAGRHEPPADFVIPVMERADIIRAVAGIQHDVMELETAALTADPGQAQELRAAAEFLARIGAAVKGQIDISLDSSRIN